MRISLSLAGVIHRQGSIAYEQYFYPGGSSSPYPGRHLCSDQTHPNAMRLFLCERLELRTQPDKEIDKQKTLPSAYDQTQGFWAGAVIAQALLYPQEALMLCLSQTCLICRAAMGVNELTADLTKDLTATFLKVS
ncbi:hypothetical protein ACFQDN_22530 [Pseudomonas asuensis]|uniref:Uncharacterized protein n=1 Tax=Pseudomonas asuensis TaxID=1825787 RepID=A0ABQ2H587_9PSED|nr:hypothetical protein [Pseudomonas asuensis]GGM32466.1 hypothetical protein GCM10009425_48710 [Pseudomonas asuensis]